MMRSHLLKRRYLHRLRVPRYFSRRTVFVLLLLTALPSALLYFLSGYPLPASSEPEIGIADLIENVRTELIKSHDSLAKRNEPALFVVKSFDMEIYYRLKRSSTVKGGTSDTKVLAINAERARETESGQKITIHMEGIGALTPTQPDKSIPISNAYRKGKGHGTTKTHD